MKIPSSFKCQFLRRLLRLYQHYNQHQHQPTQLPNDFKDYSLYFGFFFKKFSNSSMLFLAGVASPVGALVYIYGLIATPLLALLPLVTLARLFAKGHDVWQTVVGALLSLSITVAMLWVYGLIPLSGVPY